MADTPFSHAVLATDIPAAGRTIHVEADADERAALAADLGIRAVNALSAEIDLLPVRDRAFTVRGTLSAEVMQTCVVTLEPVAQRVEERIDVTLVRAEEGARRRPTETELIDALDEDVPDVYRNGRIDLGVIVAEHLALGLDPYPRAPGVDFPEHSEDVPESPFAGLKAINADRE